MHRNIHVVGLLVLSVLGSGVQWDLLQLFAWGRMISEHARTMTFAAAVGKTFDGEMCPLCGMAAAAKKQEQSLPNAPDTQSENKLLLFFQSGARVIISAPGVEFGPPGDVMLPADVCFAPPVPPPRQACA